MTTFWNCKVVAYESFDCINFVCATMLWFQLANFFCSLTIITIFCEAIKIMAARFYFYLMKYWLCSKFRFTPSLWVFDLVIISCTLCTMVTLWELIFYHSSLLSIPLRKQFLPLQWNWCQQCFCIKKNTSHNRGSFYINH